MSIDVGLCITNDKDTYEITEVNGDRVKAKYNSGGEIEVLKKTIEGLIQSRAYRITSKPTKRR